MLAENTKHSPEHKVTQNPNNYFKSVVLAGTFIRRYLKLPTFPLSLYLLFVTKNTGASILVKQHRRTIFLSNVTRFLRQHCCLEGGIPGTRNM